MEIGEKIKEIAQSKLTDPSQFVVDVIISKHKPMKISVILDGDNGINIDDCSNLSRALSQEFDEGQWMKEENYTLEVGTPGLDHPLKLKRQYKKNIGRGFTITLTNKTKVQGSLIAVEEHAISLATEVKEGKKVQLKNIEIPFSEIEKALVMVSFKK
jgi:Uncharacterized protein conserved in bacteria